MNNTGKLGFDALNSALKAAGEETRLRVLALLAEAELTVSDLTDILRQSQPRASPATSSCWPRRGLSSVSARARGPSSGSPSMAEAPKSRAR